MHPTTSAFPFDSFRMPEAPRRPGAALVELRRYVDDLLCAGRKRLAVSLTQVRTLPSGFVELLLKSREVGLDVVLLDPSPEVRSMLWFRLYAREIGDRVWAIEPEPLIPVSWDSPGRRVAR